MRRVMECPGRIVVVSAEVDPGRDRGADELTRRLRGRGFVVDQLNLLEVLPAPVRRLLSVSVLRGLLRPVRYRVRRSIPPDTCAVVATSAVATQLLRPLRRQGRLTVPVVTWVTGVLPRPGGTVGPPVDPVDLVARAAARTDVHHAARRRTFVDSLGEAVGDAIAVLAALLQASGRGGNRPD